MVPPHCSLSPADQEHGIAKSWKTCLRDRFELFFVLIAMLVLLLAFYEARVFA